MDIHDLRKKLRDKYHTLSKRQKVLVFLVSAVLLFMLGNLFLVSPVKKRAAATAAQVTALQDDTLETQTKIDLLLHEVQASLANPGSAKSRTLRGQIDELDDQLVEYYDNLIPASKMGEILQQALTSESGLKLQSIKSLRVERLSAYESADEQESVALFRKGIQLRFEGDYFSTVNYLKKLENLEWKLLWGSLDYKVMDYPTATVTIQVYTLSSEEGWIGG
jgi:MSHA biogenesis protein MshJ